MTDDGAHVPSVLLPLQRGILALLLLRQAYYAAPNHLSSACAWLEAQSKTRAPRHKYPISLRVVRIDSSA